MGAVASLSTSQPRTRPPSPISNDERIRSKVDFLVQRMSRSWAGVERRGDRRVPFPYPIHLTPCDRVGILTGEPTNVVLGRHLAERGLDFYHRRPLPHRYVIASFACGEGGWVSLLLELRRTCFDQAGWYRTGGRFLRAVSAPDPQWLVGARWEAVEPPAAAKCDEAT